MSATLLLLLLAASPIRLEEARAQSRNNVQVLRAALDQESARQNQRGARAPLLPQLSMGATAGGAVIGSQRIFTTVPDLSSPTGFSQRAVNTDATRRGNFDLSLSLNQLLYDRGQWAQLQQRGAQAEAAEGQAQEEQATSELEGISRFFSLYRSQAALDVLEKTVTRSEEQLARAQALYDAGRVQKGEALSAQVNLGNDRIAVLQGRTEKVSAEGALAVWLARPGAEELVALEPADLEKPSLPLTSLDQAQQEAQSRRPLLVALQKQVEAAQLGQRAASAGYWPRFFAAGTYSRQGPSVNPVFTDPLRQNTLSGSVNLQWNLFDGLATSAQTEQARLEWTRAQANLDQARRELAADVRRTYETLLAQRSRSELASLNREAAAASLSMADARFKAGAGSTLEVRDAQLKLTQSELALLESRVDVQVAHYALLRTTGLLDAKEKP